MFGLSQSDLYAILFYSPLVLIYLLVSPYTRDMIRAKRDSLINQKWKDTFKK